MRIDSSAHLHVSLVSCCPVGSSPSCHNSGRDTRFSWAHGLWHRAQVQKALVATIILAFTLAQPVQAQFICAGSANGSTGLGPQGASATGSPLNVACGSNANANGTGNNGNSSNTAYGFSANASGAGNLGSVNTAIGWNANASGNDSLNTAIGSSTSASGNNSFNTATGTFANAGGNASSNTATGALANASGAGSKNTAIGSDAKAAGDGSNNVAIGNLANASSAGAQNTAVGANSAATGMNSSAYGSGAQAPFLNSAAFGTGATATRANQQVFGTASNTYTLPGLPSAASTAAQSGPTQLVTTDAAGNLGTISIPSIGTASATDLVVLSQKIRKAFTGVAMAFAVSGAPTVLPNEKFVLSANWGTFQGENGAALSGAVRIYHNVQLQGSFAYGFRENMAGGHAGLRFGF